MPTALPHPFVTTADCRLIGAGDGSVMVYCSACREPLPHMSRRGTLSDALELWGQHCDDTHPAEPEPEHVVVPDPWFNPDAASAHQPPPF